ncbi:MAG: hydrogenase iron-sulfur subunit [Halarsenatibacteraceae bacterium]
MAGITEYELAWIGDRVETNFKDIQISAKDLVACQGEIGDFILTFNDQNNPAEIKAANIIINLPYQEEAVIDDGFSLLNDNYILEADRPVIILQDYPDLSAAFISQTALKRSLEIKKDNPAKEVYYFYQAMRFLEDNDRLYEEARKAGVVFLKFDIGQLSVSEDSKIKYKREDLDLQLTGTILAAPELKATDETKRLAKIFNLADGYQDYLQLDNIYLQPTLSGRRGIYLLRGSRGPTALTYFKEELDFTLKEVAKNLIGVEEIDSYERTVDDQKCILCYTCYRVCPHGAIQRDEELNSMKVMNLACQGCNLCISRCPTSAIEIDYDYFKQKASLEGETRLIICENSAEIAAEKYDSLTGENPLSGFQEIVVPCVSTVERKKIIKLLGKDSSDIMILGCVAEACKHLTGHDRCQQVVDRIKEDLGKLDLDQDRVHYKRLSPRMAKDLGGFLADWKEAVIQ